MIESLNEEKRNGEMMNASMYKLLNRALYIYLVNWKNQVDEVL